MLVVQGQDLNLLGRDWMTVLQLDWKIMFKTVMKVSDSELSSTINWHTDVFKDELGKLKEAEVRIQVDASIQPHFCKGRRSHDSRRSRQSWTDHWNT